MISPRALPLCVVFLTASVLATASGAGRELRVCADPDNLPFSNDRFEGFENKIAQLVADDLHASLTYTWYSQGKMFVRQTLNADKCDLVVGAPVGWGAVLTTKPYYSSSYVFVYRKNKYLSLSSFDDPSLRESKIGLPMIGGGGANPPPAYALARRGLSNNIVGYPMSPPGKIIEAVASGEIDVAVVWGPLGGYYAKHESVPLAVTPVTADDDNPPLRYTYEMSMGVRRGDTNFKNELERVLDRRHKQISKVLEDYDVPVISSTAGGPLSTQSMTKTKGDERWEQK